jgi:hypothetical protein
MSKVKERPSKWYKDYLTTNIKFDFKTFMDKHKLNIKGLKELTGYSHSGVTKMLERGTIKNSVIELLEQKLNCKLDKYKEA